MYRLACMYDENLGLSLQMLSLTSEIHALLNGKKKIFQILKEVGWFLPAMSKSHRGWLSVGVICIMFKEV